MFTLRDRLLCYFAQAPTEELRIDDLHAKLGVAKSLTMRAVVAEAREAGWLMVREERGKLDRREIERYVTTTPEARDFFAAPLAPDKDLQK